MRIDKQTFLALILSLSVILISLSVSLFIPNSINIDKNMASKDIKAIYSSTACMSCQKLARYLESNNIVLETFYIEKDKEEFQKRTDLDKLPTLVLKDGAVIKGYENTLKYLETNEIKLERKSGLSLIAIILAGLIDSINPCAIASLIFILSYLKLHNKEKSILSSGMLFALTIFTVYLLIGLGILFFNIAFSSNYIFPYILGVIILSICSLGIYKSIKSLTTGELKCEGGLCKIEETEEEKMTGKIRERVKKKEDEIEEIKTENEAEIKSKKMQIMGNTSIITTGIIVAFAEFACTGQVYIPTIGLAGSSPKIAIYLVIYNILFVLPIIAATILYKKFSHLNIEGIMQDHKKAISILNLLLFTGFFMFSILYYFK